MTQKHTNNLKLEKPNEKTRKTWRVELTAGERSLAETKIQRGIFQGDALSPLLFIIAMMPFNHILRKSTTGYKLSRSYEKINHLKYMDDLIWEPRKHNEKAEWINNMTKELKSHGEAPKVKIHFDLLKMTLKNIKLENAWP